MEDYSYLGSGKLLVREFGSAAPFVEVGNCSAVTLTPQTNSIVLADSTQPGGGTRNQVDRVTGWQLAYTFTDLSPDNLARATRGTASAITAGTVTDETAVAYLGGSTPLLNPAATITTVKGASGSTTYTAGTDYELRDGMLYIPSTSSIPAPVAGAANVKVTYTNVAGQRVEAQTTSQKNYEFLFAGLNEARSGKPVRLNAYKVSGGVLQEMALIGDQFGSFQVTGGLLADTSKPAGKSQYFNAVIIA
ncbi:hypothetical protein EA661_13025 [Pseudoxanthomonas winnipegensis]|uniref:Uncharacterized protein n=1 Tax=Pseudoxanthomonas winnipegensis TaxID=2480810 RepID=A0A4V2HDI3_9GAMM|nr:hypothetical protein [Pseudoxanthomonas winnipegensis]TAA27670.1 hypothetical protein EA661_13025 [Pseudoxanthomonas winnipegensis]